MRIRLRALTRYVKLGFRGLGFITRASVDRHDRDPARWINETAAGREGKKRSRGKAASAVALHDDGTSGGKSSLTATLPTQLDRRQRQQTAVPVPIESNTPGRVKQGNVARDRRQDQDASRLIEVDALVVASDQDNSTGDANIDTSSAASDNNRSLGISPGLKPNKRSW